jgi:hypothetical protein
VTSLPPCSSPLRPAVITVDLARQTVERLGGRYSTDLGIDVNAGEEERERWFLASTLFGSRISAAVAEKTFRVLESAGLRRITRRA